LLCPSSLSYSPPPPGRYPLSLHDALPIFGVAYTGAVVLSARRERQEILADYEQQYGRRSPDRSATGTHGRRAAASPIAKEVVILDRKSTRLNSSHVKISYAVFCLKKKKQQ